MYWLDFRIRSCTSDLKDHLKRFEIVLEATTTSTLLFTNLKRILHHGV